MRKELMIIALVLSLAFVLAFTDDSTANPFNYRVFGQRQEDGVEISETDENGFTYVQLDSIAPNAYVYGNIAVTYDNADKVECVSVEETPFDWGFWVWWTYAAANPYYGGGGDLYLYSSNEGEWAQQWAAWYGEYNAGPPGAIEEDGDNNIGVVRFYTSTYANASWTSPLRFGFRLKPGVTGNVTVTFKVSSNGFTNYDWENVTEQPEEYVVVINPVDLTFQEAVGEKLAKLYELQEVIENEWEGNIKKSEKNKLLAYIKNTIVRLKEQILKKYDHAEGFEEDGKDHQANQLYVSARDTLTKERVKLNPVLEFVDENLPGNEVLTAKINELEDLLEELLDAKLE